MAVARILSQRSHTVPGKLKVTEWFFEVPKDHSQPSEGGTLRLFARSAEKFDRPVDPTSDDKKLLPWLVYLAGGPGFGCRASFGMYLSIIDKGYKVLLLDHRGTGMSSTITSEILQRIGDSRKQVEYLKLFRADSIVKDAEAVRKALTQDYPDEKKKWSIMGQSFGGFCAINYLSRYPEGLREVFLTGGLAPLIKQPDALYDRLARRAVDRSRQYYEKFPEDVERMHIIAKYLFDNDVKTFSGGRLSPDRLRALGIAFGGHGGFSAVHDLLLRMANDLDMFGCLTRPTIADFDSRGTFDDAILYAVLHEPTYLGAGQAANWSAERALEKYPEFKNFDGNGKEPIMFTTEMITKSMYRDFAALASVKDTAALLAEDLDWADLYDEEQLARNEVPVYAAVYFDDLYVDFDYSMETARKIKGSKVFLTNTLYHDAIRSRNEETLGALFAMRDDVKD